jgi:hypothetical protein
MFRNLILPACTVAILALLAQNPAFAHDTVHKKVLAVAVIAVPALVLRLLIAARRTSRKKARTRELPPAPRRRRAGAVR